MKRYSNLFCALALLMALLSGANSFATNTDTLYVFDDYADMLTISIANGDPGSGYGWAGGWSTFASSPGGADNHVEVMSNSLSYPAAAKVSSYGGALAMAYSSNVANKNIGRALQNPINQDSIYISFLAYREHVASHGKLNMSAMYAGDEKLKLQIDYEGELNVLTPLAHTSSPHFTGEVIWTIIKWKNDKLQIKFYAPDATLIHSNDPDTWDVDLDVISEPAIDNLVFNFARGLLMFDELRIGSSWESMVGNLVAPGNFSISPDFGNATTGENSTTLTWDDIDNEDGYKIYIGEEVVDSVGANITSYQLTGLNQSPTYSLSVAAYNHICTSPRSNRATFSVENPGAKDFYVQDYGAVGDGVKNDFNAIIAAIKAVSEYPSEAILHFEDDKTYKCEKQGEGTLFNMNGVKNKSFWGHNSKFILQRNIVGTRISNCENILFQDFTFDFDTLGFTQGFITEVDVSGGTFTMDIEEGYPMAVNNFSNTGHPNPWGMLWEGSSGFEIKNELVYIDACELLGGQSVKFSVRSDHQPALTQFEVNDRFSVPVSDQNYPFNRVNTSSDITFRDLTYHNTISQGFVNSKNTGRLHFDGIRFQRRAGSTQLMTVYRGGIINRDNAIGPIIENCYIEGLGDDAIALSAFTYYVIATASNTQFTLNDASSHHVGDTLLFVDMEAGRELNQTVIVSKAGDDITTQEPVDGVVAGEIRAPATTNVMNISRSDNNFIIRNNTFAGQRRFAVLCRARYGVIEGNTGQNTGSGIVLTNEIGPAYSCPIPRDITIRNNSFTNIRRWPFNADFKSHTNSSEQLLRNIKVIDNAFGPATSFSSGSIVDAELKAVVTLENAGNFEFVGNTLVNDTEAGAIELSNCRNINIKCGNMFNQEPMASIDDGFLLAQNTSEEDVIFEQCINNVPELDNEKVEVKLYPVPVFDKLTIDCDGAIEWTILSIQGVEILSGTEKRLDAKYLKSGVYLMRITLGSGFIVKSFIKK